MGPIDRSAVLLSARADLIAEAVLRGIAREQVELLTDDEIVAGLLYMAD